MAMRVASKGGMLILGLMTQDVALKKSKPALLAEDEPGPVELIVGDASLVITGDHAGNLVPRALGNLGIPAGELGRHIGWDIGAAAVARLLAAELNATAVLARYSRLIIDPNRPLGDPDCFPAVSDGTPIPANAALSAEDIAARADAFYWPYHRAVDHQIARLRAAGKPPVVLCMHSFTPALSAREQARPWHIGVMFSYDDQLGRALIKGLQAEPGLVVGENEPYSGFIHGYAQKLHGLAQVLPHAQIEVRQDLIGDDAGQAKWAKILARVLAPEIE